MSEISRRTLLVGTAAVIVGEKFARARVISDQLPWQPDAESHPTPVSHEGWQFFTASEAAMTEALCDRIIPADPDTPGGKDAGCAVFLDRQLAGPYGHDEGLYMRPPFAKGLDQQGPQSQQTRGNLYRAALAALDRHCRENEGGKTWVQLSADRQDEILTELEHGKLSLQGVDGKHFFEELVKDVQQGFFADPIYGGNRDMCAWKMIGFPGAHYDYRDWVTRHNERYPHPPVSIMGRPEWTPKKS